LGDAVRKVLVLTSVLLLGGCSDGEWASMVSFDPPTYFDGAAAGTEAPGGTTAASYARIVPSPSAAAGCARVADERASDAAFADFDDATQQMVRDKTYADCMAWAARHRPAQ
jgi:hypothetical protein